MKCPNLLVNTIYLRKQKKYIEEYEYFAMPPCLENPTLRHLTAPDTEYSYPSRCNIDG